MSSFYGQRSGKGASAAMLTVRCYNNSNWAVTLIPNTVTLTGRHADLPIRGPSRFREPAPSRAAAPRRGDVGVGERLD